MAASGGIHQSGQRILFLSPLTIGAAVAATASTPVTHLAGMTYLGIHAIFLYGAGGTTVKLWIQTSFDGGTAWVDVINFAFTTAAGTKTASVSTSVTGGTAPVAVTDATAADNAIVNGVLGDRVRIKYITTGTYSGATSLAVYGVAKG